MDPREQIGDHTEALQAMLDGRQMRIWTSLPGIVQSFDPTKMTCVVQPAVQGKQTKSDGSQTIITMPLVIDCPLKLPSGGGFTLAFHPEVGDECEINFSSRCFDAWWQSGGIQPQQEFRMHDLSDGFVFVGPRSQPNVIPNIKRHSVQLRNDAGDAYLELNQDKSLNIVAPGGVMINGVAITASGNLSTAGSIIAGRGTADQINLQTHKHPTAATGAPSSPTPGT